MMLLFDMKQLNKLNTSKKVDPTAMKVALETEWSRHIKAQISLDTFVGKLGPSSASKNISIDSGRIEILILKTNFLP